MNNQAPVAAHERKRVDRTTADLFAVLDARSRDIVMRRFGLKTGQPETLESIGKDYGITRERVRQIEANAKKTLATLNNVWQWMADQLTQIFSAHGGILTEKHLTKLFNQKTGGAIEPALLLFYLEILPGFTYVAHNAVFNPHWRCDRYVFDHAEGIIQAGRDSLRRARHPVPGPQLINEIRQSIGRAAHVTPSDACITAILMASKEIAQTPFGEWGLAQWAETSPRGVGSKAYAVMRRHGKPEHFRQITNMINQAKFDAKIANPQTVHNELIKDDRFVLVGRGLYGLREWGYVPGTVADVLESILRDAHRPLPREELVARVLKQRLVKRNTVLLGLQNNKRFVKTADNLYTLKGKF